jgi:hypothetical protein
MHTEQVSGDVIALEAPGHGTEDAVVEPSAQCRGKRGVRSEAVCADVSDSELEFGERTKPPEGR